MTDEDHAAVMELYVGLRETAVVESGYTDFAWRKKEDGELTWTPTLSGVVTGVVALVFVGAMATLIGLIWRTRRQHQSYTIVAADGGAVPPNDIDPNNPFSHL